MKLAAANDDDDLSSHYVVFAQVPTVEVALDEVEGDWYLVEYVNSHDGKPIGAHTPYLCPEVRSIDPLCKNSQRGNALSSSLKLEPFAKLFWLSALHLRNAQYMYIVPIRWCEEKRWNYFCRFVFVCLVF